MTVNDLPILNAVLNGTAAILLVLGRYKIKHGDRQAHKRLMIAAFTVSVVFLVSYLTYHAVAGVVRFGGDGWSRPVYFTILTTHTILAAAVPILATITLIRGLRSRFALHRKLAKWTYPIWLYVSITGVVIYFMLYQIWTPIY